DQLGEKLTRDSGADFDAPLREEEEAARRSTRKAGGRTIRRGPIKPLAQVKPTGERPSRIVSGRVDEAEAGERRGSHAGAAPRGEGRRSRDERPAEGRAPRGEGHRGRSERAAEADAP